MLPQRLADIQRLVEAEAGEIKKIEAEYQKVVAGKRQMTEKKSENEMVLNEMNLVSEGSATVYKLVGPIMAKQDLNEAKTNVRTRLEYISKEVDRMDHLENEFNGKVEDKRKMIMKLQNEFKAEAQKMQAAAQGAAQ
jgi:prefoldin beta subunit